MKEWKKGELALVTVPAAFLYAQPDDAAGPQTDEVMSGWAVAATGAEQAGWVPIQTHYGYLGWIRREALTPLTEESLASRREDGMLRAASAWMDIYDQPKVQGRLIVSLPRGSFVSRAEEEKDGWIRIRTFQGAEGWVHERDTAPRMDDDSFLMDEGEQAVCFHRLRERILKKIPEYELRMGVVRSALAYLGAPYRWGGKAPGGIDCSGLAFMCWMENGILIYRDAQILPQYPVRKIEPANIREGDLIFFPGHVAVYLGNGKYIHATAYAKTPWVTVNSLNPADADYREDLAAGITECGTIF